MAQDALLIALEEDAAAQRDRIIQEAEEVAREIFKEAQHEAASEREERFKALSVSLERKRASLLNEARIKATGLSLEVRRAMIDEVLKEAEKRLSRLPREEYRSLMEGLYEELKGAWSEGERPLVHLDPADAVLLNGTEAEIKGDKSISLGVALVSRDGRVRLENTIPSRIKKSRNTLERLIDGILFA